MQGIPAIFPASYSSGFSYLMCYLEASLAMALSSSPSPLYLAGFHELPTSSTRPPTLPLALPPHMSASSFAVSASLDDSVPKMQPFNRSRISRMIPEPSLLEKAEHALSDRCMILEGDDAYRCYEALFEFENLKEEYTVKCDIAASEERPTACRPLERFENVVRQSNGVASLIKNVRMLSQTSKMRKGEDSLSSVTEMQASNERENQKRFSFPEPGSLPPTEEELELEKSSMMPESPFTRMLRTMGASASWFTQPPHYETT